MVHSLIKFITNVCVQDAIYWEYIKDAKGSKEMFEPPVAIKCRWDEEVSHIASGDGAVLVSQVTLLTPIDLVENSYVFQGAIDDIDIEMEDKYHPENNERALKVKKMSRTPLIKSATNIVYKAYLG